MALVGRHAVPPGGLHTIPLPAATVLVHDTEADLPVGVSLVGGTSVPAHGFGLVPLPAATVLVHAAEVDLRVGVFLVCRHAVPAYCFGVVPLDPTAVRVHDAEVVLRVGVSLFGGTLVPAYCFGVVPLDPTTVRVHGAEVALRVGVFLLGVINDNYFGRRVASLELENVTHLPQKDRTAFPADVVSDCGTRRVPVGAVGHPSADGPSSGGRVCASTAAAASTGLCRARPCSDP